jgi:subtilisin family serine protease
LPNASAFAGLSRNPLVIEVVADRVQSTSAKGGNGGGSGGGKPGDGGGDPGGSPSGTIQWGTRQIVPLGVQRVGPATDISNGEGVGVAVLDTGVDLTHPDLAANLSPAAFSAFSEGFSVEDEQGQVTNYPAEPELSDLRGHGTHVAGIIGAANNNFGVVGVASGATLYSVKVLNSSGVGLDSHVIAGLQWVADLNSSGVNPQIKVVNMSLGRPLDAGETLLSGPLHDAIQALYDSGVTIVVSAGNSPDIEISSLVPAGYSQVVAVASTTADRGPQSCPAELFGIIPSVQRDTASFFTTDGAGVVASAPGEEMEGTIWTGGLTCYLAFWGTLSTSLGGDISRQVPSPDGAFEALGTSFAAPLVAGVVARLIQTTTVVTPTSGSGVELIRLVIQDMADLSGTDPDGTPLDHPWAPLGAVSYSYDGVREGVAQAP